MRLFGYHQPHRDEPEERVSDGGPPAGIGSGIHVPEFGAVARYRASLPFGLPDGRRPPALLTARLGGASVLQSVLNLDAASVSRNLIGRR